MLVIAICASARVTTPPICNNFHQRSIAMKRAFALFAVLFSVSARMAELADWVFYPGK